ncbi:transposase family protein [Streptomyces sp. NPDC054863]
MVDRALLAHPLFTGVSIEHLAALVAELSSPWTAAEEGRRYQVRGGRRRRAPGAGARYQLVFVDRVIVTLIHLRHDLPHAVLALLFAVDRSTVTRGIGEVRTLLAQRGCAVPDRPGLRLRTLQDVFAYAQAEGIELRLDATEVQVRRPAAGRGGRRAFVSGKKKQNTMKATVIADWRGRTLWADALRPERMHDATAARAAGITGCFEHFGEVEVLLDDGYLGLSRDHPGQAITPPRKPRPGVPARRIEQWDHDRHAHPSDRITVEHALAHHKSWKQLRRWTHRHDRLPDTYRAVVSLISDCRA